MQKKDFSNFGKMSFVKREYFMKYSMETHIKKALTLILLLAFVFLSGCAALKEPEAVSILKQSMTKEDAIATLNEYYNNMRDFNFFMDIHEHKNQIKVSRALKSPLFAEQFHFLNDDTIKISGHLLRFIDKIGVRDGTIKKYRLDPHNVNLKISDIEEIFMIWGIDKIFLTLNPDAKIISKIYFDLRYLEEEYINRLRAAMRVLFPNAKFKFNFKG